MSISRNKDGFALVIALSLMSFVLLLLLTITTRTQVEAVNANQASSREKARQNALLGIQVALGELQEAMGPDQRISATGGRMDADASDLDGFDGDGGFLPADGVQADRQNWTGVWTVSKDDTGFVQTSFKKWLVSGYQESHVFSEADVLDVASDFSESEAMITGGTAVAVEAGKIEIESASNDKGYYAYWVGDEGGKAKANLSRSVVGSETTSAQYPGLSAMTNLSWVPSGSSESFDKFLTLPHFEIFATSAHESSVGESVHDITFNSFSVLCNTVTGGLKKDLTTALYDTNTRPSGALFEPVVGDDVGGPLWEQLRSWVQTQANADGELPIQKSSATQAGVYPVLTGFQLYWIPTYNADQSVRMNILPAVTLWNPYNVALQSQRYTIKSARTVMADSYFTGLNGLWMNWYLKLNPTDGEAMDTLIQQSEPLTLHLNSGVIQPGEAIVYTAPIGFNLYDFSNPDAAVDLVEGYNTGSGYYFDTGLDWSIDEAEYDYNFESLYSNGTTALPFGSRVHSFELSIDGGSNDRLQVSMYMNDNSFSSTKGGNSTMLPSPVGVMASVDLAEAYGYKFLHTFIDNQSIWGPAPSLLPNTRSWLAHQNPRALVHGPVPLMYASNNSWYDVAVTMNPSYVGALQRGDSEMSTGFESLDGNVSVGYAEGEASLKQTVLFQAAPERSELHSIGQLMHAPLYNDLDNQSDVSALENYLRTAHFGNLSPAYAIGNSLADPYIALDALFRDWETSYTAYEPSYFTFGGVHYDYSYLLNEALWDDYFFSSLPDTNAGSVPSNARLVGSASGASPADLDQLLLQPAADLLIDGGFNVNSTSVEAWKALLASFYEADVIRSESTDPVTTPASSPVLRVDTPVGAAASPAEDDINSYAGYRRLLSDQIESLAEAIVVQVKLRGPFGGLAEFVNRMPSRSDNVSFQLRGALATAIDNSSINSGLMQDASLEVQASGISGVEAEAEVGWRTEGLPGWLTQADLLARLGSVMTVRSDTFRIRGYGEFENPVGGELVSARCEAIVQRIPDFVDPVDSAETEVGALSSTTNQVFGRRFVIIDFKWLEDDGV
jgi:hypothetical protein